MFVRHLHDALESLDGDDTRTRLVRLELGACFAPHIPQLRRERVVQLAGLQRARWSRVAGALIRNLLAVSTRRARASRRCDGREYPLEEFGIVDPALVVTQRTCATWIDSVYFYNIVFKNFEHYTNVLCRDEYWQFCACARLRAGRAGDMAAGRRTLSSGGC